MLHFSGFHKFVLYVNFETKQKNITQMISERKKEYAREREREKNRMYNVRSKNR